MKVITLRKNGKAVCNSYLILGDWNRSEDVNTIIDPGPDTGLLREIESLPAGLGRIAVEQVILTHSHASHPGAIMAIKQFYQARVLAFSSGPGVDELLEDGQIVRAGDDNLEVLHTPDHCPGSICLYAPAEKILFSGNTRLRTRMPGEHITQEYLDGLLKIACRDVQRVYPGHDEPMLGGCNEMILQALRHAHHDCIP